MWRKKCIFKDECRIWDCCRCRRKQVKFSILPQTCENISELPSTPTRVATETTCRIREEIWWQSYSENELFFRKQKRIRIQIRILPNFHLTNFACFLFYFDIKLNLIDIFGTALLLWSINNAKKFNFRWIRIRSSFEKQIRWYFENRIRGRPHFNKLDPDPSKTNILTKFFNFTRFYSLSGGDIPLIKVIGGGGRGGVKQVTGNIIMIKIRWFQKIKFDCVDFYPYKPWLSQNWTLI